MIARQRMLFSEKMKSKFDLYACLLKAGANAELHVFSKGGHGFGLGEGRGKTTALWPESFAAWLGERT